MPFKVIKENILKANDEVASKIKKRLSDNGIFMMNIIASPGAGKTAFIEKAGPRLKKKGVRFSVITGDCFTSNDARRIDAAGISVIQINTGNACHIDAGFIERSLDEVDLDSIDLIIVENVGNLVCPAEFDIGEDVKIAFHSTTEGSDKPIKYPLLVKESNLVILNKVDLIGIVDFDIYSFRDNISKINPDVKLLKISSKTGEGMDEFVVWVEESIKSKKEKKV